MTTTSPDNFIQDDLFSIEPNGSIEMADDLGSLPPLEDESSPYDERTNVQKIRDDQNMELAEKRISKLKERKKAIKETSKLWPHHQASIKSLDTQSHNNEIKRIEANTRNVRAIKKTALGIVDKLTAANQLIYETELLLASYAYPKA